jgi:hypothetical protein
MWAIFEPRGPIEKGITYIVRPLIEPRKSPVRVFFISRGSIQLLVGPESSLRRLQMNVRSSTRATSPGSERERKLLGRFFSFSRMKVPEATSCSHIALYSSSVPSHQWTLSGVQSFDISSTHAFRAAFLT